MLDFSLIQAALGHLPPEKLRDALADFLPKRGSAAERARAIEQALQTPAGASIREAMARWIVDSIVPVDALVPEAYLKWRPPVRDSMIFVVSRLSPARLAPKLLEQIELPLNTRPEERLLHLVSKVPGLQKLGQVIARNQHLRPALRRALTRLENGIRDVEPEQMRRIIEDELGVKLRRYAVQLSRAILSEASVSAVLRFTWLNPKTGRRERGVFKVLKPHIPEYFAEDMDYLQKLAEYFGDRHHRYGFPAHLIPDTFRKVRRLLQHEVNFVREQKSLVEAGHLYRSTSGVRVPQVIRPLCTRDITALTEERGSKITSAAVRVPAPRRQKLADQLIEALVAVPLLSAEEDAIFHGDPHAGNLLYDAESGVLTIIDWALRERLSRDQRRHLALLFLMVALRDPVGSANEVLALTQRRFKPSSSIGQMVQAQVSSFLDELPARKLPSGVDAMQVLERVALKGVRFSAPLIMLSKVMFTLDGLVKDLAGSGSGVGFAVARHVARHWLMNRTSFRSPLHPSDWIAVQCSALLYGSRMWLRLEQSLLDRVLPRAAAAAVVRV